ncbi:MAG: ATP-binding protein [Anaerohalosphaeraceae bacterium]|nr:ATP-binding protein [Anaerohalosphaeraceae bacterium]
MKATHFQVTKFKSIEDSTPVELGDMTCLVGKNESGKTALLQALARIKPDGPIEPNFRLEDYPRKDFTNYRRRHEDSPDDVVLVTFELSESDVLELETKFGEGVVKTEQKSLTLARNYKNETTYRNFYDVFNQGAHVRFRVGQANITGEHAKALARVETLPELRDAATNVLDPSESVKKLAESLAGVDDKTFLGEVSEILDLPLFFYFDEYATLPGDIQLRELAKRIKVHEADPSKVLESSDYTAQALLRLAGVETKDFLDQNNYESLKASLEAASNHISDQVFEYWSQNKYLAVEFDLHPVRDGDRIVDTTLKIRIKNNRHRVTVPFDERSRGFVWFFSFLVAFSDHANREDNVVLLLDEPGLALHARAQSDLLRYIEQKLAPQHQVIYTTHSPFMIDPHHLERVRTVEDVDQQGTKVFDSPLRSDSDTVFPLQTALGYDLAQTLFVGPKCLLVEGPSDFVYLTIASDLLIEAGRTGLPEDLVVIPVGGADKLCTFVSLLGANQLGIAVLVDIATQDQQRLDNLIASKHLHRNRLFTYADFIEQNEADIEDLFEETDYAALVEASYAGTLAGTLDLTHNKHPRVIKRIEAALKAADEDGARFSHYRPARVLMKDAKLQKSIYQKAVLDRFEEVFKAITEAMEPRNKG